MYWPGATPASEWLGFFRPDSVIAIAGLKPKVKSARLLKTGENVSFTQDEFSLRLTGLPLQPPDHPTTVIEVQCDADPVIDHEALRYLWPRYKAGVS
jgi:alpha-L-fucosidase